MPKISDTVKTALQEITQQVKAIKESDEEDLGEMARSFDKISERADKAATTLFNADDALGATDDGDQDDEDEGEEGDEESEDEQPAEQEQQPEPKQRKSRAKA